MQNVIFNFIINFKPSVKMIGLGLTSETLLKSKHPEGELPVFFFLAGRRVASDEPKNKYILLIKTNDKCKDTNPLKSF
jgi:hypothetical protein